MSKILQRSAIIAFFVIFPLIASWSQNPARFQNEIDQFKADKTDYSAVGNLVLFTGSSTIRMWTGLTADFPGLRVLNRGFGGSEMSDLLYYADTVILQCRPSKVFIYEGDNDLASGRDPDQIIQSARKLVELIRQKLPRTPICFFSAKPSISRWNLKDKYLDFNRKLSEFAGQTPGVYFLNTWDMMIGSNGKPGPGLFLADSLHMNLTGYGLWKQATVKFMSSAFKSQGVTFGVCSALANSRRLQDIGYGFVEGSVGRDLMPGRPDSEFARKLIELDTCRLPVISCNSFIPGTLKVTGPDARPDTVLKYAEMAFRRASAAGIRFIVFGSSGARTIPEGFDRQEARRQFTSLLKKMGPIARKYGVTVAIEPLQKAETNFINSVREGLEIVRETNDPNIRLLADIYHMMVEKEGPESIIEAGKYLVHCHIAEKKDRTAPGMAGDDFKPYFSALRKIGYQGGISIEGSWKIEDLPKAFKVLNEQWSSNQ